MRGHPDQTSPAELNTIRKVVETACAGRPGVRLLEIGSWMGCSTIPLAKVAQENGGKVYCCDSWRGTPADDLSWIAGWRDVYGAFWQRIGKADLCDTVIPLRGMCQDVLPVLADKTFDFVNIDGDHRYEGVKFDIDQACRLIRKGGTIAGHDYDTGHPDVTRAVEEAFGKPKHEGRIWQINY